MTANMHKAIFPMALLLAAALLLAGCQTASAPKRISVSDIPAESKSPPQNLKQAETEKRNSVLRYHVGRWEALEKSAGNDFAKAEAAAAIASGTRSCPWAERAIALYDSALAAGEGEAALIHAGKGAAFLTCILPEDAELLSPLDFVPIPPVLDVALIAGDIASVSSDKKKKQNRAGAMYAALDKAVELAPRHPLPRLLRAHAYALAAFETRNITKDNPGIYGGANIIRDDFALLAGWTDNPASNPDYAEYLASTEWRKRYYYLRARALAEQGAFSVKETPASKAAWRNLERVSDDALDRHLARFKLAD